MRYTIILTFFTAFFTAFFLLGCSDDFLEVSNPNNLSESSFYQTESDFEDLIITCYMPMGQAQTSGRMHKLMFAMDDRVLHEQVGISALQYDPTNSDISSIYAALMRGVFRTNLFLQKFTEDIKIDEERRLTMIGEAHFLRGMYYHYLAVWYEMPPLLTLPPEDPRVGYQNATQEEIFEFAQQEFELAADLLPEVWAGSELGRATKGAALSFLGRNHLYQAKFSEAAAALEEVIDLNLYSLNMPQGTDSLDYIYAYLSNFTPIDMPHNGNVYRSEFNTESIYEINYSGAHNEGARSSEFLPLRRSTGSHMTWFHGYSAITGGFGNIAAEDKVFPDEFERPDDHPAGLTLDPRYYAFFIEPGDPLDFRPDNPLFNEVFEVGDLNSSMGSQKGVRKHLYPFHTIYTNPNAPFLDPNNWRLMRYADVLLMYAEAQVRAGGNFGDASALAAFNQVRERAGLEPVNVLSKKAIIHERDIELAGEQIRFWDLTRWYKDGWMTLEEVQQYKSNFQPRHVCFPLPLGEINRHYEEMQQNPKWL
jgi:hypothetical protein